MTKLILIIKTKINKYAMEFVINNKIIIYFFIKLNVKLNKKINLNF